MRTALALLATILCTGCSNGGPGATLIGDDLAIISPPDLAQPEDLAGADLAGADLSSPPGDLAAGDAATSKADVQLSATGCSPDLTGDIIVLAQSGSVTISQRYTPLTGSLTFDLHSSSGTITLSSDERISTGDLINLIVGTTYTNISSMQPDPIAGTVKIDAYDETTGVVNLTLSGVVLENVSTHALCTLSGTVKTTGKDF